jgi:periplasmic copper chaperone A
MVPVPIQSESLKMHKNLFALIAMVTLSNCAFAQVTVIAPWVRATVKQQKSTGAFMMLQSARDARLVGVSSPVAGKGQIHKMEMRGDMMKMQEVDSIELPAGKPVNLAAGGYHAMLIDLKRQMREGDSIALVLAVQYKDGKRETVTVNVPVKPLSFSPAH